MLLKRLGTGYEQESTRFHSNGTDIVSLLFLRYGPGKERTPDFEAFFQWNDVEALIQAFTKIDYPAAVRLNRALALASAVEDLTKIQTETPPPAVRT
jgi:hypothetical protein